MTEPPCKSQRTTKTYTAVATTATSAQDWKLDTVQKEVPKPGPSEVLVHTLVAGICRSDVHLISGKPIPLGPPGTVGGHEILGRVEAVGEGGPADLVGSVVSVYPWIGCTQCPECARGEQGLCSAPSTSKAVLGFMRGGGFGEKVLVPHYRYCFPVGDIDHNLAAILPCSGLTAYGAVKQADTPCDGFVGVFGCGGVGLMVIQLIKATTGASVVAFDVSEDKINTAKEYGADFGIVMGRGGIDTSTTEGKTALLAEIKRISERGLCSCIDTVGIHSTINTALLWVPGGGAVIRPAGNLVVIGLDGGETTINIPAMLFGKRSLCTAWLGTLQDFHELMALAKKGKLKSTVSCQVHLNALSEAIANLRDGNVKGRQVITYQDLENK